MSGLEIVVDGRWLSLEASYGDITLSTVYPGGSDEVTWTMNSPAARRLHGGELVEVLYGGVLVWSGNLLEPDASNNGQLVAQGAWNLASRYYAFDGSGNATAVPDVAIDQAIAGTPGDREPLTWKRPTSIKSTAMSIDISSGPVSLQSMLDTYGENNTQRWYIDPYRNLRMVPDPTIPDYTLAPQSTGLGFALDNYVSALYGRYVNLSGADATASASGGQYGYAEDVVDLTNRGEISATSAANILGSLLELGRAVPTWTNEIQVAYGEIYNRHGTPVALETVAASSLLRVPGGWDLAQRLNGQMYVDIVIGNTSLAGGLLNIQPVGFQGRRSLEDTFNAVIAKLKTKK